VEQAYRAAWTEGESHKRFIPFDLDELKWDKVQVSRHGDEFRSKPYTLGSVVFEIRSEPLTQLTLEWN